LAYAALAPTEPLTALPGDHLHGSLTRQVSAWLVPAAMATGAYSPAREPGARDLGHPEARRHCRQGAVLVLDCRRHDGHGASSPTSRCATSAGASTLSAVR